MAKVMKVAQAIRNNWKKSVAASVAVYFAANYAKETYRYHRIMREYCELAKRYGDVPTDSAARPRHVTVILNPAANRRKAKKDFENYCAPLLHLAGLSVAIVQTEAEGQARTYMEKFQGTTNGIIVAGGDGTLSETVTGLLRRSDGTTYARQVPLGVLPLGRTNTMAKQLFNDVSDDYIKFLAEATMAVIKEATKSVDVIKINILPTELEPDVNKKPIYSLIGVEWGAFRDAEAKRERYWYFGPLRGYASYFFTGIKDKSSEVSWDCRARIEHTPPCSGCSLCYKDRPDLQPELELQPRKSWFKVFGSRAPSNSKQSSDYSNVINEDCGKCKEGSLATSDLALFSSSIVPEHNENGTPFLQLSYGLSSLSFTDYVSEGWRREKGEDPSRPERIVGKEFKIWPLKDLPNLSADSRAVLASKSEDSDSKPKEAEKWISIDNEDYEVKAFHAKLLPNMIKMFCSI